MTREVTDLRSAKMLKYTIVSGVVFGLIALMQLVRAISQLPVQIGAYDVPVLLSWIAAMVAAALSVWAFSLAPK
jgi:hypothetical protein